MATLPSDELIGRIAHPGPIRKYITGGSSIFTIVQPDGTRYTYKVRSKAEAGHNWSTNHQNRDTYYVSILTGPNTASFGDWSYLGMLERMPDGSLQFFLTHKSGRMEGAPSMKFWRQFWQALEYGCRVDPALEFWHEGSCCICGRKLTVPSSVEAGIGPECAGKAWA